ncbi:MAG: hydroxyacylglutathione hydrolase [Rhodocyclaceae bacterium]|nr:MAG: hydroxyacylglutathione hydrolase [Rhodocyclaceae bacterium]
MEILRLRAFTDNYIWSLRHNGLLAVVDPGESGPVLDHLAQSGDRLVAILLTHHHDDHIGGLADLVALEDEKNPITVFGPAANHIPQVNRALQGGETIVLPEFGDEGAFQVIAVPGHTLGHLAYYRPGTLFCGDTLFLLGCGRLFEGSPAQMWQSLSALAALPADTQVYCAHEYTYMNLPFALAVEPGNPQLQARSVKLKEKISLGIATVPDTLGDELVTNVFLRPTQPEVIAAARRYRSETGGDTTLATPTEVFAALREWRNGYKPPTI